MPDKSSKYLIEQLYDQVWNRWDAALTRDILAPKFTFRGSLGTETIGVDEFLEYTQSIRAAFPDFHNAIESLIVEGGKAAAR